MEFEVWKNFPLVEGIEVSNIGRIKNTKTGNILKTAIDRYGYEKVSFTSNGEKYYYTVHRLVAITFIPNPLNKPQVNHKDGNKLNNKVINLEWNTASENISHSFENSLNKNTNAVMLTDLETGEVSLHRSVKKLSKFLDLCTSVLAPLIKNSPNNPIEGRYVVTLKDEKELLLKSNTLNFGRSIYVKDHLNNNIQSYPSLIIASYFTGVRCLSRPFENNDIRNVIGYSFSLNKEILSDFQLNEDLSCVQENRNKYLNTPYKRKNNRYITYNYYTKEEKIHDNIPQLIEYFSKQENLDFTPSYGSILTSIYKKGRTGLVKGHGVKVLGSQLDWTPYNEEVILFSMCGGIGFACIYRVTVCGEEKLIYGKHNLCRFLGHDVDGIQSHSVLDRIIDSFNSPDITIKRLNSPIV